jgi:hypothetical protein
VARRPRARMRSRTRRASRCRPRCSCTVERVLELAPESIEPTGRHLHETEDGPAAALEDAASLHHGRVDGLRGRWRVDLRRVDASVLHEVGVTLAIGLGDRAHEVVVRGVETASENGRQYVHRGVTVPWMSDLGTGPNVRESKLFA